MPRGRPRKEINKEHFENLCGLQCTRDEICEWFGITDKTLENWCKREYGENFSAVFAKKRGRGMISLRRAQFRLAEKNAAMAIFLGKNYLGQTDHQKEEVEVGLSDNFLDALNAQAKEVWEEE